MSAWRGWKAEWHGRWGMLVRTMPLVVMQCGMNKDITLVTAGKIRASDHRALEDNC